jgi:hypothetical protein
MSRAISAAVLLGIGALWLSACGTRERAVRVDIDFVLEHCPLIETWEASPLQVSAPGGAIDVSVTASPSPDTLDGGTDGRADAGADGGADSLEYMWTADSGTFDNSTAPTTVYRCGAAGPQTLTISVTDKHLRVPCADVVALGVNCVPSKH